MPGAGDEGAITIVLADDHAIMRSGLRMLLDAERDFGVVAEAGSVQAMLQEVRGHRPAVLVLDLNMPGGSSLDAIPRVTTFSPGTAVVVLTMDDDRAVAREAERAGARAFVRKDAAARELVRAIRGAVQG